MKNLRSKAVIEREIEKAKQYYETPPTDRESAYGIGVVDALELVLSELEAIPYQ